MFEKNITHIVPSIAEEASGMSYSVPYLCKGLISLNVDSHLVSLDALPCKLLGSKHKTFPLTRLIPARLGSSTDLYQWMKNSAINNSIDIIHNHGLWMMPNVYPGRICKKYNKIQVVSPHGTMTSWSFKHGSKVKRIFWPMVQKPALFNTTCFHATAISEYESIRSLGFRQPVAVIPIGIDIPILEKRDETRSLKTVLFLGRIHPQKGIDLLLKLWKNLEDKFVDWQLLIVGPDNIGYRKKMMLLANELQLKRVQFQNALYGHQKWQCYQQADLFVLPTHSENFGIAIAEALASGLPVITTKGAPWEGLIKYHAGWWADNDFDSLMAVFEEALSQSESELKKMGLNGRDWMIKEYSWNNVAHQTLQMYQWICGESKKPDFIFCD